MMERHLKQRIQKSSQAGFTLIEVMIVVAILGILSAIAFPSYQEHVRKARRVDAQTALMELSQFMERYYTSNGRYLSTQNKAPTLPFTESPKDSTSKSYRLGFADDSPTASGYVLEAVPQGAMLNDTCGTLTLSNTGAKGQGQGESLATCWRR